MDPDDLIQRSPLRAFDAALAGGLGAGNLGIVIARHGAGKTPFLVGVALDHLLRGARVLHVSLDQKVDEVREFYDQIFAELARTAGLDDPARVHLEMERSRRIHTYLGNSFTLDKLRGAVLFMREHASFEPELLVVDGFDFARAAAADVERLVELARAAGAELWMSAVRHRHEAVTDPDGIPQPVCACKQLAKAIVDLQTDGDVKLRLLKPLPASGEAELPIVLDRTTMLVTERGARR